MSAGRKRVYRQVRFIKRLVSHFVACKLPFASSHLPNDLLNGVHRLLCHFIGGGCELELTTSLPEPSRLAVVHQAVKEHIILLHQRGPKPSWLSSRLLLLIANN